MRYIKRRHIEPAYYDARSTRQRQLSTARVKRCGTCTYQVPEDDITIEDGQERCPMCRDTYTAQYLADEQQDVAQVQIDSALRLVQPPQFSVRALQESRPGVVTLITDSAGSVISSTSPLRMLRNVATTVILQGQYFTGACTMSYPTGLSDASAPVITPAVAGGTPALMTLSVIAASGMAPGNYSITFNDGVSSVGTTFTGILAVR